MNKILASLAAILMIASCSPKHFVQATSQKDSVRVEYRDRIVLDTVRIEIPVEKAVVVTRDTLSRLENEMAKSDAFIDHEGFLHHSLETKKQIIAAPVRVIVHDTLRIESKAEMVTEIKEVEKKISGWVKFWMNFGQACAGLLFLALLGFIAIKCGRL